MADGDTRWINRGAYDLMGVNPAADGSTAGLPRAQSLYGSIAEQLRAARFLPAQLQAMLGIRARTASTLLARSPFPISQAKGLLVWCMRCRTAWARR